MVSFFGTDTSPSSGVSSPTISRNSVVLPEPLGPTRPTLSSGLSWKEASTNRICRPYCLLMRERAINLVHNAGRMRIDVEAVAAHEAGERHAALARQIDRQRRRRGHRRDDRDAGQQRLLHDLE